MRLPPPLPASPPLAALHVISRPRALQVSKAPIALQPWVPYESAPRENYLLAYMPVKFYELRWALMRCNPLTWTVGRRSFTYGEAAVFLCVLAEMLWVTYMWALHPEFRVDVILTGAHPGFTHTCMRPMHDALA